MQQRGLTRRDPGVRAIDLEEAQEPGFGVFGILRLSGVELRFELVEVVRLDLLLALLEESLLPEVGLLGLGLGLLLLAEDGAGGHGSLASGGALRLELGGHLRRGWQR